MQVMLRQSQALNNTIPKLLVVDDDAVNRGLLQRIFENDYATVTTSNGAEALQLLEQEVFDLVLLDLMMPGIDGFEVLNRIRKNPALDDLPVIIISAKSDNSDVVHGLQLGAHDYIAKPIHIDIVRARVKTQLVLKRLSDEHKRTIEELRLARQMQDNFYQIVSHDLKGPLTNLRMAHFLLRDITGGDEQVDLILDNVELSLDEMHDMIRVFLDVMMMQPGRIQVDIDCLGVGEVLDNVVNQYRLTAEGKRIHLNLEPSDLFVMGDNRLIHQMIGNLVSNALKFSPPDTTVTLWAERDGGWLRLYVADQGPGIPAGEGDKLFKMFSRLSTRPTGSESSSGLGLWIVKQLTEAQKGCVGFESPPDGGSIFWVELPVCDADG